jgi:hypothetical protein
MKQRPDSPSLKPDMCVEVSRPFLLLLPALQDDCVSLAEIHIEKPSLRLSKNGMISSCSDKKGRIIGVV